MSNSNFLEIVKTHQPNDLKRISPLKMSDAESFLSAAFLAENINHIAETAGVFSRLMVGFGVAADKANTHATDFCLAVAKNKGTLQGRSPAHILGAAVSAAMQGFYFGIQKPDAYLIEYNGLLQLSVSYFGVLKTAKHTVRLAQCEVILRGEKAELQVDAKGNQIIIHEMKLDRCPEPNGGNIVGVYCRLHCNDGQILPYVYLSRAQVELIRKRNRSQKGEPSHAWGTDYAAMSCKCAIRKAVKYMPNVSLEEDATWVATDNKVEKVQTEDVEYVDWTNPLTADEKAKFQKFTTLQEAVDYYYQITAERLESMGQNIGRLADGSFSTDLVKTNPNIKDCFSDECRAFMATVRQNLQKAEQAAKDAAQTPKEVENDK